MNESYIENIVSVLRSTLQLLLYEVRGSSDFTEDGFREAINGLIDNVIGEAHGRTEEGESESEQGKAV